MTPYLSDADLTLYNGNALSVLRELENESVDCVITSPPYWGLRDYGEKEQLGLEPTPDLFIERLVEVFREVRRVLAPYGTVWLNIGDSYAASRSGPMGTNSDFQGSTLQGSMNAHEESRKAKEAAGRPNRRWTFEKWGLKSKDLCLIPARLAIALQEDGWWVRSDVIWSKLNPLPESVTDRPTKAHEYLFLLTKSGRSLYWTNAMRGTSSATKPAPDYWWFPSAGTIADPVPDRLWDHAAESDWERRNVWVGHDYFYDQEATREPAAWERWGKQTTPKYEGTDTSSGWMQERSKEDLKRYGSGNSGRKHGVDVGAAHGTEGDVGRSFEWEYDGRGRNMRSVWEIPTQSFPGAHFATFPLELARRALLAGCPVRVCTICGVPQESTKASCGHETGFVPGTVMDPFAGSGTVAVVARAQSRQAVLIELNSDYCEMIVERTRQLSLLS